MEGDAAKAAANAIETTEARKGPVFMHHL